MKKYLRFILIFFLFIGRNHFLFSQDYNFEEYIQQEFGFWLGGSFPAPNSKTEKIFNSSMSLGFFYRYYWPKPFHLELGTSYANYKSLSMQQITTVPVYLSLNYPFPMFTKFQLLGKIGFGASYLEIRPNNLSGWDPMLYGGLDFAIFASKRFKVGLRLDGYFIYDSYRKKPDELKYLFLLPGSYDYRIVNSLNYKNQNVIFYNFGLMVSFLF
ncbi:MAG: hypothetical protein ACK4UJ_11600 [Leptonema sp. (in: bacteria)]